jgi:hypothetical protein
MDLSDLVIGELAGSEVTTILSVSDTVAVLPYGIHALCSQA